MSQQGVARPDTGEALGRDGALSKDTSREGEGRAAWNFGTGGREFESHQPRTCFRGAA